MLPEGPVLDWAVESDDGIDTLSTSNSSSFQTRAEPTFGGLSAASHRRLTVGENVRRAAACAVKP